MGANKTHAAIELTDEERQILEGYAGRRSTSQALALPSRLTLRCAGGGLSTEIAAELGVFRETVGRWRRRFQKLRVKGLHDEPRPGAPRTITDQTVERVVVETLETTPKGATHYIWTK